MAFNYSSSNLSSSGLSQVRRLIGDVSSSAAQFDDGEVRFFITEESTIYGAAGTALRAWQASVSDQVSKSVGPLQISLSDKATALGAMAAKYEAMAATKGTQQVYAGGISQADKDVTKSDTDFVTPFFTRDMFDLPGTTISTTNG